MSVCYACVLRAGRATVCSGLSDAMERRGHAFLARLSVISGSTNSPKTWRSYAYEFADWLGFCKRIGIGLAACYGTRHCQVSEHPRIRTEYADGADPQAEHDQSQAG